MSMLGEQGAATALAAVGSAVHHLRVGDPVVLAGDSCGECRQSSTLSWNSQRSSIMQAPHLGLRAVQT